MQASGLETFMLYSDPCNCNREEEGYHIDYVESGMACVLDLALRAPNMPIKLTISLRVASSYSKNEALQDIWVLMTKNSACQGLSGTSTPKRVRFSADK